MKLLGRILRTLVVLIVVAGLVVSGGLYWLIHRPLPQTSGNLAVSGLKGPVEVIRDKWGVPHIYALNSDDLFFAQGYVTAQDRLAQMEFDRHLAAGRLSEFGGQSTLETDRFLRTLGLYRAAQADAASLKPELKAILDAYAQGVNAFIDTHRDNLPLEYMILNKLGGANIVPEAWQAVDTIAWGKVMAYSLCGNLGYELFRALLRSRAGDDRAAQIEPGYPEDGPFIVKGASSGAMLDATMPQTPPEIESSLISLQQQWDRVRAIALTGDLDAAGSGDTPDFSGIGSNSWLVDGSKSTTGRPLVANDMHLGIQNPSIWYEVHLEAPGVRLAGLTFAGVPGIVAGHNDRIAWGFTNAMADVQDLYIEKINPQNPLQYEYQGAWQDARLIHEEIQVKGQQPVGLDIVQTRHGPIVTDVTGNTSDRVALRWTAYEPGHLFEAVIALWSARNWQDFRSALQTWDTPSQNVIYADVDGNTGYVMTGLIPIRAKGDGAVPVPGWTGEYEWTGWIPSADLPSTYNPANHFIATANNRTIDYSYKYFLSNEWAPPYRAQRIEELLAAKDKLSIQDMRDIQADVYNSADRELVTYLLALAPQNDGQRRALDMLKTWDFRLTEDSAAASIAETTLIYALRNTFADDLGDQTNRFLVAAVPALLRFLPDPNNPWFDNTTTPAKETRDDLLARSLQSTIDDLTKRLGSDMSTWRWGRLHTATFKHQALGGVSPVNLLFNLGPIPLGGGGNSATIYSASYNFSNPYGVGTISSERAIYDLSNFDNSLMVQPIGQSGQPGSRHFGDQLLPWRDVKHHAMPFSRPAVEEQKEASLVMTPR